MIIKNRSSSLATPSITELKALFNGRVIAPDDARYEQARTVFYGMIRVEPQAHGTQGYQANNNLLLDNAHAHAIPGLEILANDVSCSHGATVSRIDQEQRFYLQARAIPPEEADQLVVQGFLSPIIAGAAMTQPIRRPGASSFDRVPR